MRRPDTAVVKFPGGSTRSGTRRGGMARFSGKRFDCNAGFTLIEILVSLAIMSVVLGALIQAAGASASNAGRIRDRTIAQWVASNRLAEMQIAGSFPSTGSRTGNAEMLGVTWYWKTDVQNVEDEDLRRVDVEVRRDEDAHNPILTVAGFVSHPRLNSRNVSPP